MGDIIDRLKRVAAFDVKTDLDTMRMCNEAIREIAFLRKEMALAAIASEASGKVAEAGKQLAEALRHAKGTVECASIDVNTGEELPWYRHAKAALAAWNELEGQT